MTDCVENVSATTADPAGTAGLAAMPGPAGAPAAEAAADPAVWEAVAFAAAALAPFFLNDPRTGEAPDAFAALAELDVDAAAAEWPFADEAEAREALGLMRAGLAAGADHDDLVWEYRRLFVGPGHLPAPPWGSVYTDHDCVIFGEGTLALRAWMRARGIQRLADERTPEDHIRLMLALLAFLASERSELADEYLRDHLLPWAPHYLEELAEAAEHPFYEGLARLTRATLLGMQQARELAVSVPRFYR